MSRKSGSGATSSDTMKDTGLAPDVLSVLEKHFSSDPLRESGGWTPRAKNQAPSKDDTTPAIVAPKTSEAPTTGERADTATTPPNSQAPSTGGVASAATPSDPKPSKLLSSKV
ncbi:unnamed protein product [Linum trigynum]|uniref:Uncharacterized protein n=1 Tax=Linum trigynum TaxID=586398 RepID=A0AAV2DEF8_9ROSI